MILIIKGFVIGIGKIIPGVSGAMMAMSLGVYEQAMQAISEYRKNPIAHFKYLCQLGIGAMIAIILGSKLIAYFLNNYYLATMLLFIGLIFGGIPSIVHKTQVSKSKIKHFVIFILAFLVVFLFSFLGKQNLFVNADNLPLQMFLYMIIGVIDAVTMVIPGISGTAIMMLLGCYHLFINLLSSLSDVTMIISNLKLLLPMAMGLLIGVIMTAKLMNYLFKKHKQGTYCGILGFAISSIFLLFSTLFNQSYSFFEIIIGLLCLVIGIYLGNHLGET